LEKLLLKKALYPAPIEENGYEKQLIKLVLTHVSLNNNNYVFISAQSHWIASLAGRKTRRGLYFIRWNRWHIICLH